MLFDKILVKINVMLKMYDVDDDDGITIKVYINNYHGIIKIGWDSLATIYFRQF
jgi:hypothetical protein